MNAGPKPHATNPRIRFPMKLLTALFALALCALPASASGRPPASPARKAHPYVFVGTWVATNDYGERLVLELNPDRTLCLSCDETVIFCHRPKGDSATYRIDRSKSPMWIDATVTGREDGKTDVVRCILEPMDENHIRIGLRPFEKARPRGFDQLSADEIYIFERTKSPLP